MSSASSQINATIAQIPLNADVAEYCIRFGLTDFLGLAIEMARSTFPEVRDIRAVLEEDPDSGDKRVILDVFIHASIDAALKGNQEFHSRWVSIAPPQVCLRIGALYTFV